MTKRKFYKGLPKRDWVKIGIFGLLIALIFIESIRIVQEFKTADFDIITMVLSTLIGYCIKKVVAELKQKKDQ